MSLDSDTTSHSSEETHSSTTDVVQEASAVELQTKLAPSTLAAAPHDEPNLEASTATISISNNSNSSRESDTSSIKDSLSSSSLPQDIASSSNGCSSASPSPSSLVIIEESPNSNDSTSYSSCSSSAYSSLNSKSPRSVSPTEKKGSKVAHSSTQNLTTRYERPIRLYLKM